MNKTEFAELIQNPERIGKKEIEVLRELSGHFPYFQGAQVLIAKGLSNLSHYEFEKQLQRTALSVPDRQVLFRLIQSGEYGEATVSVNDLMPAMDVSVELPASPLILPEAPSPVDEEVTMKEEVAEVSVTETMDVAAFPSDQSAKADSPALDVREVSWPSDETQPVVVPEVKGVLPVNEEHTFAEWLQLARGHGLNTVEAIARMEEQESVADSAEEEEVQAESEITEPMQKEFQAEDPEKLTSNLNAFESILDRFIRESPSISRPKAEFYKPSNMAKQSVEEDEDLVTETLAKLYFSQGHYKKAIRAYEKLCLIYPHKMAYFADLIQKIKQENKE